MKKRITALLTSIAPLWVWASAGLLIGLLVVLIGTIIIVKLYYVIKIVLPDNPKPTNDVETTYYYDHGQAAMLMNTNIVIMKGETFANPLASGGFPLQYGVDSYDGLPWICAGTNLVCTATNYSYIGPIYTFENDSNCIDLVVATGGTLNRVTYTATNDWTTNYPLCVVIQSSTNLVNWHSIMVDTGCVPDAVGNFVDTNATSGSNFYRLFYQ